MGQYALRLPDSLKKQVKKVAAEDSVSVNQFILSAVAEKTATIATENFFAERAGKGDVKSFLEVLSRYHQSPGQEASTMSSARVYRAIARYAIIASR